MTRKCNYCGRSYTAKRQQSKFCSTNCRVKNSRAVPSVPVRSSGKTVTKGATSVTDRAPSVDQAANSLIIATRSELEAYGVADSLMGQQALRIAEQMSGFETANGLASLSKELSRVMVEATRSAVIVDDPTDELRLRREAKRGA